MYYKEVTERLSCSYQQFYNILRALERKGIIRYTKASYYDYDVEILDNALYDEDGFNEGYISLSKGLYCEEFMKLRAGAKLLGMELLRRQDIQFHKLRKPSLCFKTETLYEKFCGMLHVTKRVLLGYLEELREFFSIGIKDGKYYITPLKSAYSREEGPSDSARYQENEVRACCRRNRIDRTSYSPDALRDTAYLMTQYRLRALEKGMDIVGLVLDTIIESVEKGGKYKASERRLEPKLIHRLLRQKLDANIIPEGREA